MKTIFLIILFFTISESSQSQTWVKIYKEGPSEELPYDMVIDNAGNIIVAGYAITDNNTNYQLAVVKYSPAGILLWDVTYGFLPPAQEFPAKIASDAQGNIYVTGHLRMGAAATYNVMTVKFNTSGVFQWADFYDSGPGSKDIGEDIQLDSEGSAYVSVESDIGSSNWARVIKYNSAGSRQWVLTLDSARGNIILEKESGSFYFPYFKRGKLYIAKYTGSGLLQWVTPYTGSSLGASPVIKDANNNLYGVGPSVQKLFKFDSTGTFQWGDSSLVSQGQYKDLALDPSGNIYVSGWVNTGPGIDRILIRKFNPAGTILWTTYYDEPDGGGESGDLISVDSLGNCYVVGHYAHEAFDGNIVTIKLNSSGVIQWTDTYGGASGDYDRACRVIAKNPDEVYVSLGSANHGITPDFATLKYGNGLVQINPAGNSVPSKFNLYQNYPNPFNPETNIRFDLPKASNVKITIYSSLGKEMQVLADEHKQAGSYEVKFNAAGYAGGVYFYRIEAGGYSVAKKLIILK